MHDAIGVAEEEALKFKDKLKSVESQPHVHTLVISKWKKKDNK